MGGGVWYIAQGGTGLSTVTANRFLTVNNSGNYETTAAIPLPVNKGGTGISTVTANKFMTTDGTGAVVTTVDVPTSTIIGANDVQTLTNKTFGSTVNFSSNPTAFSLGSNYLINWSTPAASRTYTIADMGTNTNFAFTDGAQTFTNKTITDSTNSVTANALFTTTNNVAVNGSAAPTNNQVLTATSASTATWQNQKVMSIMSFISPATYTVSQLVSPGISVWGVGGSGTAVIAANTLVLGSTIRIKLRGTWRPNTDAISYTITSTISLGGNTVTTFSIGYPSTNQTDVFMYDVIIYVTNTGTTGGCRGYVTYIASNGTSAVNSQNSTAGTVTTLNTTIANTVGFVQVLTGGSGTTGQMVLYDSTMDVYTPSV